MIKVVLDTNIIISASFFGGMCEIVIDLIFDNKLQFYTSSALIQEIFKKLTELHADEDTFSKVDALLASGILLFPSQSVSVCRDPKDNFLLELAEAAQADYLLTRDKDLLELSEGKWRIAPILKPEAFLAIVRKQKILK